MKQLCYTLKLSSFGIGQSSLMPHGYHPEYGNESPVDRTLRILDETGDMIGGIEYKYPVELHENNASLIKKVAGAKKITSIEVAYSRLSQYREGGFINPLKRKRDEVLQLVKGAIELGAEYSAAVIIRPFCESYRYPLSPGLEKSWDLFMEGIIQSIEFAQSKKVQLMLEPVQGDAGSTPLLDSTLKSLYLVQKIRGMGLKADSLKLILSANILKNRSESPSEMAVLLFKENILGGVTLNSFLNWNQEEAFWFSWILNSKGFGKKGELVGMDLPPSPQGQAETFKVEIEYWNGFFEKASRFPKTKINEYQKSGEIPPLRREIQKILISH